MSPKGVVLAAARAPALDAEHTHATGECACCRATAALLKAAELLRRLEAVAS